MALLLKLLSFSLFISLTLSVKETLLENVLHGVEKAAIFFSRDLSDLNVDGLYGLRLGEGQVMSALQECQRKECDAEVVIRLENLINLISTTARKAMPYIEEQDEEYFRKFLPVINSPYLLKYIPYKFEQSDENDEVGTDNLYDEEYGDMCYSRILGSYNENGRVTPKCNVTDACLEFMTRKNTSRYTITHQLLYFVLAEHIGCEDKIEYDINTTKRDMCKMIYKESKLFVVDGEVSDENQDLFLEQTVLCASLGYEDFQHTDWMKMVLRWQGHNGCFPMTTESAEMLIESIDNNKSASRKLLRESIMKDGCLAHKSGLGFSVLATYLHYLVRNM